MTMEKCVGKVGSYDLYGKNGCTSSWVTITVKCCVGNDDRRVCVGNDDMS